MMHTDWTPRTFEDLACYWFLIHGTTHKAASSLKRDQGILRNYILPRFGKMALPGLHINHLEEWFADLKQNGRLCPKSCNDVLGLFKKICNDGERWGFIAVNPANRVKKLRLPEQDFAFWSLEDTRQYLGFWGASTEKPRIFYSALVALYTGMRRGELSGLMWDCVDEVAGLITVKRSYCRIEKKVKEETKSKKIRRIPICAILAQRLTEIKSFTGSSGYVLPFFHPDLYHKEFKDSARRAKVKIIRFHDLRHTFASHFLMGGGNIYDLQRILGHSTVQVTERYTHLVPDHLHGKTEVLGF
ncbi:MAG: site-specific integrase [Deltaproteobacteria bacterium]|nr:site-specific integrase [Deltaproteobacteria bacterium]